MLRNVRYLIEFLFLIIGLLFFRLLPLDIASAFGGMLARLIGPRVKVHKIAEKNLRMAIPGLSDSEYRRILDDMWDNLGRTVGEYPHLSRQIMYSRITVEGLENIQEIKYSEKASLFVSGHFANFEIAPLTAALYGMPLVLIYRAANNPFADWIIRKIRSCYYRAMYKKGRQGAQAVLHAVEEGMPIGMLVDQKMNNGKSISFFGHPAMTATAATTLAIKMQIPLLAGRVVRTDGAHFQVYIEPPEYYDKHKNSEEAMQEIHHLFESWIREHPAQWFWVHQRWGNGQN